MSGARTGFCRDTSHADPRPDRWSSARSTAPGTGDVPGLRLTTAHIVRLVSLAPSLTQAGGRAAQALEHLSMAVEQLLHRCNFQALTSLTLGFAKLKVSGGLAHRCLSPNRPRWGSQGLTTCSNCTCMTLNSVTVVLGSHRSSQERNGVRTQPPLVVPKGTVSGPISLRYVFSSCTAYGMGGCWGHLHASGVGVLLWLFHDSRLPFQQRAPP